MSSAPHTGRHIAVSAVLAGIEHGITVVLIGAAT